MGNSRALKTDFELQETSYHSGGGLTSALVSNPDSEQPRAGRWSSVAGVLAAHLNC